MTPSQNRRHEAMSASRTLQSNETEILIESTLQEVKLFYRENPQIKESHGLEHVLAVVSHAERAIACCSPSLSLNDAMEIIIASFLHDVDDSKYFPNETLPYQNAKTIMNTVGIPEASQERILNMIDWTSCSKNGNSVPCPVKETGNYHLLIPRWSDRLEAVGKVGVVRCYQYTQENGGALCSDESPRATTVEQVWKYATPERFESYQARGGTSDDMISHYYDKLLRVARPPKEIVRNAHLEKMAEERVQPLIEVCLRFGRTGVVDEDYILGLCQST